MYFKFKDDIIVCLNVDVPSFMAEFRAAADHYILKIACMSVQSVPMLDLTLTARAWGGTLDTSIFFKGTLQAVPLSSLSHHSPCVHMSWPTGRIKRF